MPFAGVLHNGHLGVAVDFKMQQDTPTMDDIFNVLFPGEFLLKKAADMFSRVSFAVNSQIG